MRPFIWQVCFSLILSTGCATGDIPEVDGDETDGAAPVVTPEDRDQGQTPLSDMGQTNADPGPSDQGMAPDLSVDMAATDLGSHDAAVDMGPVDPCDSQPGSQGWEALGLPLNARIAESSAATPSVTVDDSCRPLVAFHESDADVRRDVFVYRFDGTDWQPLGGALDASNDDDISTSGVRIATFNDHPYVAWTENDSNGDPGVFVFRWDASSWQQVGNVPVVGRLSTGSLGFEIDASGRPIVAWYARLATGEKLHIYVARHEAGVWTQLGQALIDDSTSSLGALAPTVAIDDQNRPLVAWQESGRIHLRRFQSGTWSDFAGGPIISANGNFSAFGAVVRTASNGQPVLGWRESTTNNQTNVFVERWNGSSFEVLASDVDTEPETDGRTNTGNLDLIVDSQDRTIFAFDEPEVTFGGILNVHIFRHEGASYDPLGVGRFSIHEGDTSASTPSLDVDSRDRVILGFSEQSPGGGRDVHVWRYSD